MFVCNICGKEFEKMIQLGGHKSSHSRQAGHVKKKINCAYCGIQFEANQSSNKKFCSVGCFKSKVQQDKEDRYVVIHSKKHDSHILDITVRELEEYRKKQPVCEICGKEETIKGGKIKLSVDHNHNTYKFRGLLCYACNVKLAWVEKEWGNLKKYLERDSFDF